MKNKLESLGWKFVTSWNNRNIYKLGNQRVFEHNGRIGIVQEWEKLNKWRKKRENNFPHF